jgi:hypothetical protein
MTFWSSSVATATPPIQKVMRRSWDELQRKTVGMAMPWRYHAAPWPLAVSDGSLMEL